MNKNTNSPELNTFNSAMKEFENSLASPTPDTISRNAFLAAKEEVEKLALSAPESATNITHVLSYVHQAMCGLADRYLNAFYGMLTQILSFIRNSESYTHIFRIISLCADTYVSTYERQNRLVSDTESSRLEIWYLKYNDAVLSLMKFLTSSRGDRPHEWELLSYLASNLQGSEADWKSVLSNLTARYTVKNVNNEPVSTVTPNPYPNRVAIIYKKTKENKADDANQLVTGMLHSYNNDSLTVDNPDVERAYTINFESIRALISL